MDKRVEEINIQEILSIIISKWWLIIIAMCLCIIATSVYTFAYTDPIYSADTTIYVGQNTESKSEIAYNDLMLADRLINDYRQLIKSRMVTGLVIEELGLKMSSGGLAGKITVNSLPDTRIIQITVKDGSPATASTIANKIAEVFQQKVVDIMKVENVQVIDVAVPAASPVNSNARNNIIISGFVGLLLGAGLVFLLEYLDRTIKTPQDVRNSVDLPVLGMIPEFEQRLVK